MDGTAGPRAGSDPTVEPRAGRVWQGVLIACAPLLLLAQCWRAEFIGYDDALHIHLHPLFQSRSLLDVFKVVPESTYFPLTIFSYKLDFVLFAKASVAALGSWAPAVRLMTCAYHAAAALLLWRFLLRLGVKRGAAFFIALVFAVHPMACETVCWAAERKNALAGMFGFAALWAWAGPERSRWRVPVASLLYALANLSKPSALGLLPVLVLLELYGGPAGLAGLRGMCWRPGRAWAAIALRTVPLAAISAVIVYLNLVGHERVIVAPLGGGVLPTLLADTEVLARYLASICAPVKLSAAYYVGSIDNLLAVRSWLWPYAGYASALVCAVGLTVWLADNRRRAAFGWLWFLCALTPTLNVIALSHAMQDRYVYLSLPGFFLVLTEAAAGISGRVQAVSVGVWRAAAVAYLAALGALSLSRSAVFASAFDLFYDATQKQPLAAHAHYGLSKAYAQGYEARRKDPACSPQDAAEMYRFFGEECRAFLDKCPDAERQVTYMSVALDAGDYCRSQQDWAGAERYYRMAAEPPPYFKALPKRRALAWQELARIQLRLGRPRDAYESARSAWRQHPELDDTALLLQGQAALAVAAAERAAGKGRDAAAWEDTAQLALKMIPRESKASEKAEALLRELEGRR